MQIRFREPSLPPVVIPAFRRVVFLFFFLFVFSVLFHSVSAVEQRRGNHPIAFASLNPNVSFARDSLVSRIQYIYTYIPYSLGITRVRVHRVNGLRYFNNETHPKDLVHEKVRTFCRQWRLVVHMTILFTFLLSRFRVRTKSLPAI